MLTDHKPCAGTLLLRTHILPHSIPTAALEESSNLISTLLITRHRKLTGFPRTQWPLQMLNADRLLPEPCALSSDVMKIIC